MMMASGGRLNTGFNGWLRDNGFIIATIIGWAVTTTIFAIDLSTRVRVIEQRGSPEMTSVIGRIAAIEEHIRDDDKQREKNNVVGRLQIHEQKIAVIERNNAAELEMIRDQSSTLKYLTDMITKHMIDTSQNNNGRK